MRIARFRKDARLTQAELADACGWESGQGRIGNYEKDKREPSLTDLKNLSMVLGCSLTDLVEGHDTASRSPFLESPRIGPAIGLVNRIQTTGSAPDDSLAILDEVLASTGSKIENLRYGLMSDSSMDPTINTNDIILIDLSLNEPKDKSIFAILTFDRKITARRFFQTADGKWIARSDNPDRRIYPEESSLNWEISAARILGGIVWRGGAV